MEFNGADYCIQTETDHGKELTSFILSRDNDKNEEKAVVDKETSVGNYGISRVTVGKKG